MPLNILIASKNLSRVALLSPLDRTLPAISRSLRQKMEKNNVLVIFTQYYGLDFVKDNKRFLTRRILALLTYLMYKAKDKEYNGNIKIKDHYRVF